MIIYLYVKTHNVTRLKYLGQTAKQDPHKYRGSGKHWGRHLKVHGYDYTTEILHECTSKDEVKMLGLYYSELWNVVESKEWANLKPESGDGGSISPSPSKGKIIGPRSEETKEKQRGENNHFFGKTHSAETKILISENRPDSAGSNNANWKGGPEFHKYKNKFSCESTRHAARSKFAIENNPMADPAVRQKHLESVRSRPVFVCYHCGVSMVKAGLVVHHKALALKGLLP